MQKTIFVEATFQIVATAKGHVLAKPQTLVLPVNIEIMDCECPQKQFGMVLSAVVQTAIKNEASKAFIQRLKTETPLKRAIGGTKWNVDLVGGVEVQPLYLKEAKVGDFYKFLKGKKVMRWDDERKEQYPSVIYPKLQEQIIERNSALVQQLYDQPVTHEAANDNNTQQAA